MIKKIIFLTAAVLLIFTLSSCKGNGGEDVTESNKTTVDENRSMSGYVDDSDIPLDIGDSVE